MSVTTTTTSAPQRANYRRILLEAAKAIGLSVAVNVVLYFVFSAAGLIDPEVAVTPDGQSIDSPVPVIMSTVMGLVVATLVFLALVRFTRNPGRIFTWVAIVVFTLYLFMPFFAIKDVPVGMAIALDLMHIPPAYLIWRFLTRSVA